LSHDPWRLLPTGAFRFSLPGSYRGETDRGEGGRGREGSDDDDHGSGGDDGSGGGGGGCGGGGCDSESAAKGGPVI